MQLTRSPGLLGTRHRPKGYMYMIHNNRGLSVFCPHILMRKLSPRLFSDSLIIKQPIRDRASVAPGQMQPELLILSLKTCCLSFRSSKKSPSAVTPTTTAFLVSQAPVKPIISHLYTYSSLLFTASRFTF